MSAAFTPGPWHANYDDGDWYVCASVQSVPTIVADIEPMVRSAIVEANARLIASAPELLDSLTWALAQIVPETLNRNSAWDGWETANAVAEKARGEA